MALQINNWNKNRKDKITEKHTLNELAENLELNIVQFENKLERITKSNYSSEIVDSIIKSSKDDNTKYEHWHESLLNHSNLFLSQAGYESLKNEGFAIIRNEKLRTGIVNLYENTYLQLTRQKEWGTEIRSDFDKFILEHLIFIGDRQWKPRDFDFLISNFYFQGLFNIAKRKRNFYQTFYLVYVEETRKVLVLIHGELEKFK